MLVKRGLCLVLIAGMFLLPGCSRNEESPTAAAPSDTEETQIQSEKSLGLPIADSDPLNPYTATTLTNRTVMPLLFDSLFIATPENQVEPGIAREIQYQGNTATITLKDNIVFSDGTALQAKDVVESLGAARTSTFYAAQLSNITNVSGKGNTVTLQLAHPDSLLGYVLTVPICKAGTTGNNPPTGSGRYTLEDAGTQKALVYNPLFREGKQPLYDRVSLMAMPSLDTMETSLKTGKIDLVYRGTVENTMGGTGSVVQYGPSSQMVFIGVNGTTGITTDAKVRQAFSLATDRDTLVKTVFHENAAQTSTPLYPGMFSENSCGNQENNIETANQLLDDAGFAQKGKYGIRQFGGRPISIECIVSQDSAYQLLVANVLADNLYQCGVTIQVTQLPAQTYADRIAAGNYQMYVGEILLTPNYDLSPFFYGMASPGLAVSESLRAAYQSFLSEANQAEAFMEVFEDEVPFIPVCYRDAAVTKSLELTSNLQISQTDACYNILDWE